jgi:hypothetical protein
MAAAACRRCSGVAVTCCRCRGQIAIGTSARRMCRQHQRSGETQQPQRDAGLVQRGSVGAPWAAATSRRSPRAGPWTGGAAAQHQQCRCCLGHARWLPLTQHRRCTADAEQAAPVMTLPRVESRRPAPARRWAARCTARLARRRLALSLLSTTTSQAPSPPPQAPPCRAPSSSRWASRPTRTRPSTS